MAKSSIGKPRARRKAAALDPALLQRVVIEGVYPEVDGGRFPVKRTAGESVIVNADVHADGHDVLAAVMLYRRRGESAWSEVPMAALGNDRWTAGFTVNAPGRYEYTLEAWVDRFATWRSEISRKFDAGQSVAAELLEGALILEGAGSAEGAEGADLSAGEPWRRRKVQRGRHGGCATRR